MKSWLGLYCVLWLTAGLFAEESALFSANARILFQGDSITDGNRGRSPDPNHILGHGYAFIVAAKHGGHFPELKLEFLNRGVSGNTVLDLQKRWKADTLDLQPTVLSILIGANDSTRNVPFEEYEQVYDQLLTETKQALPQIKFVLCEPFALPSGKRKDNWETWSKLVERRRAIVAKLAEKHAAPLVRFQLAFDEALQRAPAEYWIWDGVHPTYSGHQIMADQWDRDVAEYWRKK